MIINRAHAPWAGVVVLLTAISGLLYAANYSPGVLPFSLAPPAWFGPVPPMVSNFGGTPLGVIFGTVALLIFIFAALLGWRRKHPAVKVGSMQSWLKAHIWLTVFTIPMVVLHCGFHAGGPMTKVLLLLYGVVMVSGFFGLAMQHFLPSLMREKLPDEVVFDQIPFLRARLYLKALALKEDLVSLFPSTPEGAASEMDAHAAATVASTATRVAEAEAAKTEVSIVPPVVFEFIDQEVLAYVEAEKSLLQYQEAFIHEAGQPKNANSSFARALSDFIRLRKETNAPARAQRRRTHLREKGVSDSLFRSIKLHAPEAALPLLDEIKDLCNQKRRLDLQVVMQRWLHSWIFVHAPLSFLLIILTCWHAVVAMFVY